jgi:D-lactate dehydrogenase
MKIVCFDVKDYERAELGKLSKVASDVVLLEDSFHINFESNYEKIKDADIISVFVNSRLWADKLSKLPNLKYVSTRSTGFSHIDLDYCKEHNIAVSNVPRYGDITVAEYAFALLMSLTKKVTESASDLKNNVINPGSYIGTELFRKTVGVIGVGSIGGQFCRIAHGLGMNILGYDLYPNQEYTDKYGVNFVSMNELLAQSDIISVHAPSTKENLHLIDAPQFELMKKGVIIINTARGEIINTKALYDALLEGKVGGAGLDVLECEDILTNQDKFLQKDECKIQDCLEKTLINHRLLTMKNVIITPHVAFDTHEAVERILAVTLDNIQMFLNGEIKNNVIK